MPTTRTLIVTGLKIPFLGRAPGDGKALARQLAERFPQAGVEHADWNDPLEVESLARADRIVLIGHSFGGARCVRLARQLERLGKRVDDMLLLDPVPTKLAERWLKGAMRVSRNVARLACIHRRWRLYPRSKKAKGVPGGTNRGVGIGHDDFFRSDQVVAAIERAIGGA